MDEMQFKRVMERLDEIERNCYRHIDEKMAEVQNSLLYVSKILSGEETQIRGVLNESDKWRKKMSEKITDLVRLDVGYKNFNSVLRAIYVQLRNVYGVVIDQIRKDYKDTYGLDYYPSAMVAISDNYTYREIFANILTGMFPASASIDPVADNLDTDIEENTPTEPVKRDDQDRMEQIRKAVEPIAVAMGDRSVNMSRTWRMVYDRMGFSWHNLQVRYAKKNGLKRLPKNITIIASNQRVYARFKKVISEMEDELTQPKAA